MPADQGKILTRVIKPHTLEKLRFHQKYVSAYAVATKASIERVYIEGFSGPGYNRLEGSTERIDGSPLNALKTNPPFTSYHFIDIDTGNTDSLRAVVETERPELSSKCRVYPGDCNAELPQVLSRIERRAPVLLFLDPEGLELRWSTLVAASKYPKVELFLLFYVSGVARNWDLPQSQDTLTAFFGTTDWRKISSPTSTGFRHEVLSFYIGRLASIGYTQGVSPVSVTGKSGNHLYYLIWRAHRDNPKAQVGQRIMRYVFDHDKDQANLFD